VVPVNPAGGKIARAHAVTPQVQSGNVYLPHPLIAHWVEEFLDEVAAFAAGRNDDQVDAMTQALNWLRRISGWQMIRTSEFTVDRLSMSTTWSRAFTLAITGDTAAILWGAKDRRGALYVYAEQFFPQADPSLIVAAVEAHGKWIPGFICSKGSIEQRGSMATYYAELGLDVTASYLDEELAIHQLPQLIRSGQLKVCASLTNLLAQYPLGDEESPLLRCLLGLIVADPAEMRSGPPKPERLPPRVPDYGPQGWMAS
jgi:hypothetical protein